MQSLIDSFKQINANHRFELCLNAHEVDRFEESIGLQLPTDLRVFYRAYRSVALFEHSMGPTYRIVPLAEMNLTRCDILGSYDSEKFPNTWYTVCDVLDGNYVAVDLMRSDPLAIEAKYIDCFHETFAIPGESKVIALSFTEFLSNALNGNGDVAYFLQQEFIGHGDAFA